jgi:hypothetical protein
MKKRTGKRSIRRPLSMSIVAIINGIACVLTLAFWSLVYFKQLVPRPGTLFSMTQRANAAVTYGFMFGDIVYAVPLLLIAAIGVWRLKDWGWTAAQMVNALWVYSVTVILYRDLYTKLSPGSVLFLPFAIASIWSFAYLWKHRRFFL